MTIRLLTALLKARVQFMVVGLSAATLQGAPAVTQDVDLWFEKHEAQASLPSAKGELAKAIESQQHAIEFRRSLLTALTAERRMAQGGLARTLLKLSALQQDSDAAVVARDS